MPEIRTLADGYEVIHHEDGKQLLRPGQSRLRQRLLDAHDGHKVSHAAKQIRKKNLVEWRRDRMRRRGVPPEKRCL